MDEGMESRILVIYGALKRQEASDQDSFTRFLTTEMANRADGVLPISELEAMYNVPTGPKDQRCKVKYPSPVLATCNWPVLHIPREPLKKQEPPEDGAGHSRDLAEAPNKRQMLDQDEEAEAVNDEDLEEVVNLFNNRRQRMMGEEYKLRLAKNLGVEDVY